MNDRTSHSTWHHKDYLFSTISTHPHVSTYLCLSVGVEDQILSWGIIASEGCDKVESYGSTLSK